MYCLKPHTVHSSRYESRIRKYITSSRFLYHKHTYVYTQNNAYWTNPAPPNKQSPHRALTTNHRQHKTKETERQPYFSPTWRPFLTPRASVPWRRTFLDPPGRLPPYIAGWPSSTTPSSLRTVELKETMWPLIKKKQNILYIYICSFGDDFLIVKYNFKNVMGGLPGTSQKCP